MMTKAQTFYSANNSLTDAIRQGRNTGVESIAKTISFMLAPIMVRGLQSGNTCTAAMLPHRPRTMLGVFSALQRKWGILWKV